MCLYLSVSAHRCRTFVFSFVSNWYIEACNRQRWCRTATFVCFAQNLFRNVSLSLTLYVILLHFTSFVLFKRTIQIVTFHLSLAQFRFHMNSFSFSFSTHWKNEPNIIIMIIIKKKLYRFSFTLTPTDLCVLKLMMYAHKLHACICFR